MSVIATSETTLRSGKVAVCGKAIVMAATTKLYDVLGKKTK